MGHWQIFRLVYSVVHTAPPWKKFAPWLLYFFVALMGFVLAGALNRWIDADDLRFLYLPFGSYMLLAGFGLLTYHLFRLDPLPIPRRTLFAVLTVPGLVIFCIAYAVGLLTLWTDPDSAPSLTYHYLAPRVEIAGRSEPDQTPVERAAMTWVEIDPALMGVSLTGKVPDLTSPWGETHPAWSEQVVRGLPIRVYNPYNTPDPATANFEALLATRAIERTLGDSIPYTEIRDRYLVIEDGRITGLRQPQMSIEDLTQREPDRPDTIDLLADQSDSGRPHKGPETPVYLVLALVPWLLLTAFIVRFFRAAHSNRYIRWMYWLALGLLMGSMLLQVLLAVFGLFSPEAARTLLAVTIQQLGSTPLLWASTWIVGLVLIVLAYRIALSEFERAEIPASPINCSWVDWGAET